MAHLHILTAMDIHGVKTEDEYRQAFMAFCQMRAAYGGTVQIHEEPPVHVRVNDGAWIADCTCKGAGSAHPAFVHSCCFGCAAVRIAIFPPDWAAIERVLLARPNQWNRNWRQKILPTDRADDTLGSLLFENAINDLGGAV